MAGLFSSFITEPVKHLVSLLTNPEYFTYHRLVTQLRWKRRYQPFSVHVHGWHLSLPDSASFLSGYKAIFLDNTYAFAYDGDAPEILDLGANVGLSVLFFKRLFPAAKIMALEPDPLIFQFLERNITGNGISEVELVKKAAWVNNMRLPFLSKGDDSGHLVAAGEQGALEVEAIDLREILEHRHFDFIKMDIEGAEKTVLPACSQYLNNLRYFFLEFHSWAGQGQGLAEILGILAQAGFRLSLKEVWASKQPFLRLDANPFGFDFQANIFAWRP